MTNEDYKNLCDMEKEIALIRLSHVTDWISLSEFPAAGSLKNRGLSKFAQEYWDNFRIDQYCGVYQVSLTRPKQLVNEDIGYIGSSEHLPNRIFDLKKSSMPGVKNEKHMCGVYLREENIDVNDVYVRFIYPKVDTFKEQKAAVQVIERWLQVEHRNRFKYDLGYAWEEASAGRKSSRIQCQTTIKRLDTIDACIKVQEVLSQKMKELEVKILNDAGLNKLQEFNAVVNN